MTAGAEFTCESEGRLPPGMNGQKRHVSAEDALRHHLRDPERSGCAQHGLLSSSDTPTVQISLALDNAIACGRVTASKNCLEEGRLCLESEIRSEYDFEDIGGGSETLRWIMLQVAQVAACIRRQRRAIING